MKPPQRRRSAPARYLGEVTGPVPWSLREKRQLLRLLMTRRGQPEPSAAELARELWSRSEAEIHDFLQHLKGRVARETSQRVHAGGPQGPRRSQAQILAPIEVWTDLAKKITGPLEEPLTAAFSQALTIAATEPLSLLRSKPPKPTKAREKTLLLSAARGQEDRTPEASGPIAEVPGPTPTLVASGPSPNVCDLSFGPTPDVSVVPTPVPFGSVPKASGPAPEVPGPAPNVSGPVPETRSSAPEAPAESLAGLLPEGDFTVDFEKIYKYLSFSSRSGQGPELSGAESAVVLDLLLSLPEELPRLPCTALVEYLTETYDRLMAPEPSPSGGCPGPGAENEGTDASVREEPGLASPGSPEHSVPSALRSNWQAAGVCPLNPFLVPLELLGRAAAPTV
ncbi:snRNA-activating protein complex subunit 2 [Octodon degus]|uniref:snRNA-activating protein complex subunit 2 n=1 Tax=Octodon degus TaxID=10160 RepID=A0A6P3FTD1_OCTDE|nr:snRNA-activating protein complex subunit 2 [Octodon degus]